MLKSDELIDGGATMRHRGTPSHWSFLFVGMNLSALIFSADRVAIYYVSFNFFVFPHSVLNSAEERTDWTFISQCSNLFPMDMRHVAMLVPHVLADYLRPVPIECASLNFWRMWKYAPISSFPSKNLFGAESQSLKRDNQTTFFYIHRKNGTASHVNTSKVAYIVIIYHLIQPWIILLLLPRTPPKRNDL